MSTAIRSFTGLKTNNRGGLLGGHLYSKRRPCAHNEPTDRTQSQLAVSLSTCITTFVAKSSHWHRHQACLPPFSSACPRRCLLVLTHSSLSLSRLLARSLSPPPPVLLSALSTLLNASSIVRHQPALLMLAAKAPAHLLENGARCRRAAHLFGASSLVAWYCIVAPIVVAMVAMPQSHPASVGQLGCARLQ